MKNLIGIEFGEGAISIYQKQKDGAVMLFKDVPLQSNRDIQVSDKDVQIDAIKELLETEKLDGKECAVVLPEKFSFFRTLYLPPMTDEELKINIPYEFKDYVGDKSSEYVYDYAMNNIFYDDHNEAAEMELFAAAGNNAAIDRIEHILDQVGLKLSVVLPKEMAIINLFKNAEEYGLDIDQEYCLVNVGYSSTRVDIISKGIITGSKVIDFGSHSIDRAIAKKYGIDEQEASEYRRENFDNVLNGAECNKVYDSLGLEIMKAINFYRIEHPDCDINELHFVGMEADCKQMRSSVAEGLDMIEKDVYDILPYDCKDLEDAYRGIGAVGVTL